MDLYIYYQVKDADTASLQAAVVPMQAELARRHAVACQLKRRPEASDGLQTWMEVYAGVPAGFAAGLAEAVERAGLAKWTHGARHTEVFTDLVPCV
nr:DUF4936 family protein [uncultured Duganella sp.]